MTDPRTSLEPAAAQALALQGATGLALLDAEGLFRWANPAWAEALGVSPRRWLGEPLQALDPAVPTLAEALARVRREAGTVQLRRVHLAPPGARALDADLAFTALADGGVLLELHALSPEVERTAPRLSESLRGFAHEVKNPLAGLRGAAQLLRRRLPAGDLADLAELILAEADRLGALADRLLHASARPHLTRFSIHEPIERVVALLAAADDAPRIVRDFDPSLPPLRGDLDRLTQLLLNLGRNAIQAGAHTLTLRTRVERGVHLGERILRTALRVDVIDDGRGVPAELQDSLFLPLVSGRAEGSGLGLALCQEIAREHGGSLGFRSRPGDTVFTLLLPLELPHA